MKTQNLLTKLFLLIDIFGKKTEFQMDQRPKFATISGGFFSLIYFGLIILLFLSFGKDMIYQTNPDTSISQILTAKPSQTTVGQNSYFFMFGIQDYNWNHFIDNSIYTVKFIQKNKTASEDIDIPIEPCTEAHLPVDPKLHEYFMNAAGPLENLWCIRRGLDEQFLMKGSWDQAEYNSLILSIRPCVNSTLNSSGVQNVCKPPDQINAILKSGFFAFYSVNNLFDMRNHEQPSKSYGLDFYVPTTTKVKKIIVRFLKTNYIHTSDDWISNSLKTEDVYSWDFDKESFELLDGVDDIVWMELRKSNYETVFTRNYKKIQNVFAEMTGFLQIIFLVLFFVSNPFIKKEYYESLTNGIYNFEVDEEGKKTKIYSKKKNRKSSKSENLENFKNMIQSQINNDETELEQNSQKKISAKQKKDYDKLVSAFFKTKESPLNLSMMEYIKSNFTNDPELSVKKKQRDTGVFSIFSQLDIKFVLRKFAEIEKLKMLLLDEDQYRLFEYLPKPTILKNSKIHINYVKLDKSSPFKKKSDFINHTTDAISKARAVQRAYRNIKNKPQLSDVDFKLIECLDPDIMRFLEEGELLKSENKIPHSNEYDLPVEEEKPTITEEVHIVCGHSDDVVIAGKDDRKNEMI